MSSRFRLPLLGVCFFCLLGVAAADDTRVSQPARSAAAQAAASNGPLVPRRLHVKVLGVYPHDPQAFTQGLVLYGTSLFESTGLEGRSSLREVDLTTGKVLRRLEVPLPYFGEGLALAGDRLIQLTWQHGTAFVYDTFTFAERNRFTYRGEGWGLTFDGRQLAMSDGSDELTFRDPQTFDEQRRLKVTRAGAPQKRLNELEWVDNRIYANIWTTPNIAAIDPQSGAVVDWIDAGNLLTREEAARADVLNGIAYDRKTGDFLITGKLWPKLFRVRFTEE